MFNRDLIYLESNLKLRTHLEDLEIPKAEPLLGFLFQGLTVIFLSMFSFLTPKFCGDKALLSPQLTRALQRFICNNVSEQCFSAHETESLCSLVIRKT